MSLPSQIFLSVTDDCDNETGFWVCSECRLLSTRTTNIESVLLSFVGQYEDVHTKLAQKSAELIHSQAENSRLRDRLKKGAQNSQPETVNTHPPNTELEEEKKRRGTLLVGSSVIREITKYTYDCDTDPICVRGGRVSDITAKLLSSSNDEPDQNIIL
jgi:regulator of replication initiation timing